MILRCKRDNEELWREIPDSRRVESEFVIVTVKQIICQRLEAIGNNF